MKRQGLLPGVKEDKIPKIVAHIRMQTARVRAMGTCPCAQILHDRINCLEIQGYGPGQGSESSAFPGVQAHMMIQCRLQFSPDCGVCPQGIK
jgi:hypothetical protein